MAYEYIATCADCAYEFKFVRGDSMSALQTVCDDCGAVGDVPRYVPRDAVNELTEARIAEFLRPESRQSWPHRGGAFSPAEAAIRDRLTKFCACGGYRRWSGDKDATYRCPKCKSNRFSQIKSTGLHFD